MKNLAFMGKMRSGKDTVASILSENNQVESLAFGDGIKEVAWKYFPELMKQGKQRKLLQEIGQTFRRHHQHVWINHLDRRFKRSNMPNVFVTDLRQPNEHFYLKQNGFTIVKVHVDRDIQIERLKASGDHYELADLDHETEKHIDYLPFDYTVFNNGSLEDLQQQLKQLKGIL
ncbi:AAA family ATPase [Alkalicoccobacillus gibsonii]|uniref:deoxynucleotide monophosphate kinase family protein n=1 Tax=Alkalicoccobacillus gibsonii TaxID=79881 RepID=UPI00351129E6